MGTTEIDWRDLDAAVRDLPVGEPVMMVNLLRFRPVADYAAPVPAGVQDQPAVSGREAYLERYLPAFNQAMAPHGVSELVFAGAVVARVVGPTDVVWDAVAVVTYASIQAFSDLVGDPAYVTGAAPHRLAALADWQLLATRALGD